MASTVLELVVNVYSGRNFPRLPTGHGVRVQATVANQVCETLPSVKKNKGGRIGSIFWKDGGTLTWTISREQLAEMKARNPTVKLYVFSSGASHAGALKDTKALGYITIDLRSPNLYMARSDIKPKWCKVKAGGSFGGELQVSSKVSAKAANLSGVKGASPNPLESMVVSADASHVQIGQGKNNRVFNLEVTIIATKGLDGLPLEAGSTRDYWLTYCMFGVVTETDKFTSPDRPDFHPIVDSFRIRSDRRAFADFLEHEARPLDIYLRTEDSRVAVAKIDLSKLASVMRGANFHGAEIEGSYIFHSLFETTQSGSSRRRGVKPLLAAKIAIRPADDGSPMSEEEVDEPNVFGTIAGTTVESVESQQPTQAIDDVSCIDAEKASSARRIEGQAESKVGAPAEEEGENEDDGYGDDDFEEEDEPETAEKPAVALSNGGDDAAADPSATVDLSESVSSLPPRINDSPHKFRVSIDLRSIKEVAQRGTYCLEYAYPAIGCISPIRTRPPIKIDRNSEVLLPHGYTAFDFVMEPSKLYEELQQSPLTVELRVKDKYQKDERVGIATIPFQPILASKEYFRDPKTRKTFATMGLLKSHQRMSRGRDKSTGQAPKYVTVRAHDQYFQCISEVEMATSKNGAGSPQFGAQRLAKTASIRVVVYVEDLGPTSTKPAESTPQANVGVWKGAQRMDRASTIVKDDASIGLPSHSDLVQQNSVSFGQTINESSVPRNPETPIRKSASMGNVTAEMIATDSITQAAVQKWFADEYMEWEEKMKRKEESRMQQLETEWASREGERHQAVIEAQERYATLEEKLRRRLALVEQRERELALKESDLQRSAELQLAESKILQRRLEEELHHKLGIERQRAKEIEKRWKEAEKGKKTARSRVEAVEDDFHKYKEAQRRMPESKLRQKINSLMVEKAEMEAGLVQQQAENKFKEDALDQCRSQLSRVVKELQAERRAKREASEKGLEQLRLQYLAREERYILDGDRQELRSIKDELDSLRRANMFGGGKSAPTPSRIARRTNYGSGQDTNVERLQKERSLLLGTGAYDNEHPIIKEIDRQIEIAGGQG
jgi:hypothetical protein|eukprot:g5223.t1